MLVLLNSHEQGKDREVLTLHETIIIYSKTANYNYVLLTKNQQILTLVVCGRCKIAIYISCFAFSRPKST
jgi:hypothetical protein